MCSPDIAFIVLQCNVKTSAIFENRCNYKGKSKTFEIKNTLYIYFKNLNFYERSVKGLEKEALNFYKFIELPVPLRVHSFFISAWPISTRPFGQSLNVLK